MCVEKFVADQIYLADYGHAQPKFRKQVVKLRRQIYSKFETTFSSSQTLFCCTSIRMFIAKRCCEEIWSLFRWSRKHEEKQHEQFTDGIHSDEFSNRISILRRIGMTIAFLKISKTMTVKFWPRPRFFSTVFYKTFSRVDDVIYYEWEDDLRTISWSTHLRWFGGTVKQGRSGSGAKMQSWVAACEVTRIVVSCLRVLIDARTASWLRTLTTAI